MTLLQQRDDIGVGKLCKLGVMGADGDKGDRGAEENNLVDLSSQLVERVLGRHWNSQDDFCRSRLSDGTKRRPHGAAGGDPVIDDDDRRAGER